MTQFPALKTGSVAQYPATRTHEFVTQVQRFMDGSEQRYRDALGSRRRWIIELSRLDESELAAIRNFVDKVRGSSSAFEFSDPWSESGPQLCRLSEDSSTFESDGEFDSRTVLIIASAE